MRPRLQVGMLSRNKEREVVPHNLERQCDHSNTLQLLPAWGASHKEGRDTLAVRLSGRVNSLQQPCTQTAANKHK
jgi:hypothetical protein